MSKMIEIYYPSSDQPKTKQEIEQILERNYGKITFEEVEEARVTLTVEYEQEAQAQESKVELEKMGLHVEGPTDY